MTPLRKDMLTRITACIFVLCLFAFLLGFEVRALVLIAPVPGP